MNNQRRHELEHNILAERLESLFERIGPLLKPIGIAVAIGLVILFASSIFRGQSSKKAASQWTKYYFNLSDGDAESFQDLASEMGDWPAGKWARHAAGQGFYQDGIDAIYTNRSESQTNLKNAIAQWETIKDSAIPELRSAARLGLAQAHESLGELDKSIGFYQMLLDGGNISESQRSQIKEQIAYLKTDTAKKFYSWFEKLDPKPAPSPVISGDLSQPPTSPSITLDPSALPALPATSPAPSESGSLDASSLPPAPEVPVGDKPSPSPTAATTDPATTTDPAPIGSDPVNK